MLSMTPSCSYTDTTYSFCQYKPFSHNLFFRTCLFWLTKIKWYCSIFLSLSECSFILHQLIIVIYSQHVPKRAGCQSPFQGGESTGGPDCPFPAPPGLPLPCPNPGPHFSTLQRCCRVSSPVREQLFSCPGLSLAVDVYLGFGWCSSACQQGLWPSPRRLAQPARALRGCTPSAWALPSCTTAALGPRPPGPEEATGLHRSLAVSSGLLEPWAGHHGDRPPWWSHSPCCPPDSKPAPRAALAPHCPQTFHTDWAGAWGFLHQMHLILPAVPSGQPVSALPAPFTPGSQERP